MSSKDAFKIFITCLINIQFFLFVATAEKFLFSYRIKHFKVFFKHERFPATVEDSSDQLSCPSRTRRKSEESSEIELDSVFCPKQAPV